MSKNKVTIKSPNPYHRAAMVSAGFLARTVPAKRGKGKPYKRQDNKRRDGRGDPEA